MFWALGDIGRAGDLIFSAYKLSKQHTKSINNGAALTRSLVCTANCRCPVCQHGRDFLSVVHVVSLIK